MQHVPRASAAGQSADSPEANFFEALAEGLQAASQPEIM